ncbi:hypothetical protein LS684_13605 [Cytobacillus spongiae]|uniref:hypothetical protein n=1 Tax=Cytobacillus spongiae TaxID=2901381 RepID=UPI001F16D026|nr:hypothetical protein [Cytobacillus spongiae]UII54695.1 hypothetical protein LS684_13605 [Cytobacillus spongiae]
MIIQHCRGYELEKAQSNTSEDFFNRSEICYIEDGQERSLHVLYVRYFEEQMAEFTPFSSDPVFQAGDRQVEFKDLVALACLLNHPGFRHRKRVYINNQAEFASFFKTLDFEKLPKLFEELETKQSFEVRSPLEYIVQPS